MTSKTLPDVVTHLDILKTIAVVLMIIDHIGLFFFPDDTVFRAIGRLCVPIWFFLIGYARSRDIPTLWLVGALIVMSVDFALFQKVFAFNILVTMMFIRIILDRCMAILLLSRIHLVMGFVLMCLFFVATNMVIEYGTLGLIFAVAGYFARNKDKIILNSFVTQWDFVIYMAGSVVAFSLLQNAIFSFGETITSVIVLATGGIMFVLITMQSMTFPSLSMPLLKAMLQFGGRKTLEIYVAHLVVFKLIIWGIYLFAK